MPPKLAGLEKLKSFLDERVTDFDPTTPPEVMTPPTSPGDKKPLKTPEYKSDKDHVIANKMVILFETHLRDLDAQNDAQKVTNTVLKNQLQVLLGHIEQHKAPSTDIHCIVDLLNYLCFRGHQNDYADDKLKNLSLAFQCSVPPRSHEFTIKIKQEQIKQKFKIEAEDKGKGKVKDGYKTRPSQIITNFFSNPADKISPTDTIIQNMKAFAKYLELELSADHLDKFNKKLVEMNTPVAGKRLT